MKDTCIFLTLALLLASASANTFEQQVPEIIAAIESGDLNKVNSAIKYTTNLNKPSEYSHPPLHVASYRGETSIMQLLVKHGADPRIPDTRRAETPLHMAVSGHQVEAVKLLLTYNVNLEAQTVGGGTPLTEACFDGNIAIAKVLLEAGAAVNSPKGTPWLPLTAASQQAEVSLVDHLLNRGADPNLGSAGGTPLIYAVLSDIDSEPKVRLLLRRGAKPDVPGLVYGWNATQWAANKGSWEIIELFADAGADLNQIDAKGRSLSEIAEEAGHSDVAKRIRQK
jgi:ankyrin repeat protein